jgi:hypothetical protein
VGGLGNEIVQMELSEEAKVTSMEGVEWKLEFSDGMDD